MDKKDIWTLIGCFIVVYGAAFIASYSSSSETDSEWFNSIRPEWTPPNWVFPVVWNIIYIMIALSLFLAWKPSADYHRSLIVFSFGHNLFFNFMWTFIFFVLKDPLLAFADMLLLIASTLMIMYVTRDVNKISSRLMIPYIIWLLFASILNYQAIMNTSA